jgi:hypothetical protein
MDTITSTIKPTSQVIVISDSKEKGWNFTSICCWRIDKSRPMEEEELQQDVVEEQT